MLGRNGELERVALHPRLRASRLFAIRDAAPAGLGMAALPQHVAEPMVALGPLRVVLRRRTLPEVPVHAVFASARFVAPTVRAFVELAVQTFGGGRVQPPGAVAEAVRFELTDGMNRRRFSRPVP